jgi:excinuclease UvrABC nuclease subunit
MKKHTLYRIYYDENLVYLGRTNQPISTRLRGHFFDKPMHKKIDINQVTKIEISELKTEADMFIYEIYYINKLKPTLNRDDKSRSEVTINLPELKFEEFYPPRMEVWKKEVENREKQAIKWHQEQEEWAERKRQARRSMSSDDYSNWLEIMEGVE